MNELYQSPVLYALGWAIAGSFWQMGLLWLVHQLIFVIPFRQRPEVKHGSAVLLLGSGTAWFMVSFFLRLEKLREMQSYIYRIDPETVKIPANTSYSLMNLVTEGEKFLPYFSAAYLLVLAFLFFRLAQGILITHQESHSKHLQPALNWQHFVDRICVQLNINREVIVYLSETITVPATAGFIKPVILLPVATLNQLTISQAEAVILHEIAHIKRFDYFINIIVSMVETLLFFNPFARLFSISIRKERELCCDDFVISYQRDPHSYAHALLSLEKSRNTLKLAIAATGTESLLLGRVKRILQIPDQQVQYRHRLLALFVVASLIMFMAILNPPKGHMHFARPGSSLLKQQVNGNLYYSLPTIFSSIQKDFPSLNGSAENRLKNEETKQAPSEKKSKEKSPGQNSLFFAGGLEESPLAPIGELPGEVVPSPMEDAYAFAFPNGPGIAMAPVFPADNNQFFEFQPNAEQTREFAFRQPSPNEWKIFRKKEEDIPAEILRLNEESLAKFYSMIDTENKMANEEKLNVAIEGQKLENMMPGFKSFQDKIIRKNNSLNEQGLRERETDLIQSTRERIRSKPVVRTFSSEDGTIISILRDNGKIEITLKDNR